MYSSMYIHLCIYVSKYRFVYKYTDMYLHTFEIFRKNDDDNDMYKKCMHLLIRSHIGDSV
jgi:hypothetical protein